MYTRRQACLDRAKRVGLGLLLLAGGWGAGALAQAPQAAPSYPSRPITIVVPFAAGGGSDITARLIGQKLGEMLKSTVLIDNKAGANTQIATSFVVNSRPDGHTLLLGTTSLINNVHLYARLPYDASRELRPVIGLVDVPAFLMVGPKVSARNAKEFIAAGRASAGSWNYASAGAGSSLHLGVEWFLQNTGIKASHIPQRGSGPAVVALASGNVEFSFENYGPALPQLQAGRVRMLAVASPRRFPLLADVPTLHEVGLPDVNLASWFVLMAPSGTPDAVVSLLNDKVNQILQMPEIKDRLLNLGLVPLGGTPEELLERMRQDSGKWGALIRSAKVSVE